MFDGTADTSVTVALARNSDSGMLSEQRMETNERTVGLRAEKGT